MKRIKKAIPIIRSIFYYGTVRENKKRGQKSPLFKEQLAGTFALAGGHCLS